MSNYYTFDPVHSIGSKLGFRSAYLPNNKQGRTFLELYKIGCHHSNLFFPAFSLTNGGYANVCNVPFKTDPWSYRGIHAYPDEMWQHRLYDALQRIGVDVFMLRQDALERINITTVQPGVIYC